MSGIEVHLYDTDNSTHLAVLEQAFEIRYGDVLSGVGAGQFSIPLASPFATIEVVDGPTIMVSATNFLAISASDQLLSSSPAAALDKPGMIEGGHIARLRIHNVDVGAFIIEKLDVPDVLQTRVMTCSGRSLLALFDRATVWPSDTSNYATMEKAYSAKTFAYIIEDLMTAAAARGVTLPADDFSPTNDSDGVAFVDSNTVQYKGGTSLLDVILQHADLGIEVTIGPTGILHYYKSGGAGQDRSATVYFRERQNVLSAGRTEQHANLANAILGDGQSILSAQTDATSIATYGRRERLASMGNISNSATLATMTQQTRDQWKNPQSSLRISVEPDTVMPIGYQQLEPQSPFIDYGLGDLVTVDLPTDGLLESYRVWGISLAGDGESLVVEVTLGTLIDDYLLRVDQALRRLLLSPLEAIVSGGTAV